MNRITMVLIVITCILLGHLSGVSAQNLDSTNYRIEDPTVDSGGGTATSTNYSGLFSAANVTADARLTSGNYELKSGFPNGILANVPKITCFETSTTSGTTGCSYFPNSNGAQGECGAPGCYDRAKIEIDDQGNPIDTLYLVMVEDTTNTVTYYLQSDHTIGTSYDINDFLTQCQIEGRDNDDTSCDDSGDGSWDESLQRYNVLGLLTDTTYQVSASALSGDFTGTRFSTTDSATTVSTTISFDLDIASTDIDSSAPYAVDLGELFSVSVTTATDMIWVDLATNAFNGANVFVRDTNGELTSSLTGETVPSESEDLATDPNSNGGYGLKISTSTESALGPLQEGSTHSTVGAHEVGAITSTNVAILFTDTTGSNVGPLLAGRASILIKARAANTDVAAGDLSDDVTFIAVSNF
ncbi:MAG: hypothetical protein ACE5DX_03935 [Candidatus Dojkabacteria bacterium]